MTNNNGTTSSPNDGIDIRQALDILSGRSGQEATHSEGCCHHNSQEAPPNAESMGQTIDLLKEDTTDTAMTAEEVEALQKRVEEERSQRKIELEEKLRSMAVKELLQTALEAQQQRVRTYGDYDRYVRILSISNADKKCTVSP
jgi:hypothetical protein